MARSYRSERSTISRRDFVRHAALSAAGITALSATLPAIAESDPTSKRSVLQQSQEEPRLSPESRSEVEARIQAIFRKYGPRLSEEQKADVRRLVREAQKGLESLRAFRLENADQPAAVFKLYP